MRATRVGLDHGSGGEASQALIEQIVLSRLDNPLLRPLDDSAVVVIPGGRVALTTDSYVVDPPFFPGGNIGSLAIHGTVNDLSMQGATPLYLTLSLILEEGLPMTDLIRVIDAAAQASREAEVSVVTGDTKVVPRGHADKIFINTSGVGIIAQGVEVGVHNARTGDLLLINGNIGDHGMAILSRRKGLDFRSPIESDSAPLNALVAALLSQVSGVHALRDPTRGGLATALNDLARRSRVGILLREEDLPFSEAVSAAAEILGLDPLYVANEGKCLVCVAHEEGRRALEVMRAHKYGRAAAIIGEVTEAHPGRVLLKTRVGGTRMVSMLTGEPLPRIC